MVKMKADFDRTGYKKEELDLGSGHLLKSTRAGIDSGAMQFFWFIWVGHENFRLYLGGS